MPYYDERIETLPRDKLAELQGEKLRALPVVRRRRGDAPLPRRRRLRIGKPQMGESVVIVAVAAVYFMFLIGGTPLDVFAHLTDSAFVYAVLVMLVIGLLIYLPRRERGVLRSDTVIEALLQVGTLDPH